MRCGVLRDERVDAEPGAALEARDEQVGVLKLVEPLGGVRAVQSRVAQLRRELAEHRDTLEEGSVILVERRKDLRAQVVGDEALVAAESRYGSGGIVEARSQTPARTSRRAILRALDQYVDLLRSQLDPEPIDEQGVGLGRGEGQVVRAQFVELLGRTHAWEPDPRVDARADDHAEVLRHVEESVIDRRQAVWVADRVQVIEHQDHRPRVPAEGADHLVDSVLDHASGDAEPTKRRSGQAGAASG